MFDFSLMSIIAGLPGLLLALVLHEYAHARVAVAMGDFTPKLTGRLTLNPMAHIDPIGLLMLLVCRFGWAKPVMVNPRNFKDMKKGNILVALAGPAANFLTAFVTLFIMMVLFKMGMLNTVGIKTVLSMIVLFNINFGIFNLIPLPPLDGSKILLEFLPGELAYKYMGIERYSFIILIILIMTPVLSSILVPLSSLILHIFETILSVIL
ncbi:MAG: site-2 protease family protein [Anaerovibrio sp.]|uniref:Peptidase n=2 Tax=Anaerovibrio lipolyticus TaxID=82374 RepID=A0A0B2JWZ1_9FIRM|nr:MULTISPECIES: site-2 protease family protein [Anaerovibrio]KHM52134.1 peptidase [Anaerovibrio lipolyticus]MBO5589536.1 site-2 protease family protein [Anaerovibrio sp.]MBO6246123.1 site-2 protease family protein [Anaerovibrio sp.]SHI69504.1 Zn-dependent protease (includes SpoIVFB) [Anaerovibrio lipolyticus DSM 3074]